MDDSVENPRKSLYKLLWNYATQCFTSKDYRASASFYLAAMAYAEPEAKAAVSRQLVLVQKAMPDVFRSAHPLL